MTEFKHSSITSKTQLPKDVPVEKHIWVRIRDPNADKKKTFYSIQNHAALDSRLFITIALNHTTQPILSSQYTNGSRCLCNRYSYGHRWLGYYTFNILSSVKSGPNLTSLLSFQCTKSFRGTSHLGKLLLNYASYSSFTKNVSLAQDLPTSNRDQTIQVQKPVLFMVSPLHYRYPRRYHQDGFNDPTPMQYAAEYPSHPRREEH